MLIKLALIISIVLQFAAAIIAMTLIKRTRSNIAWWLISFAFLLMAIRRVFEILQIYDTDSRLITGMLSSWTGVLISVVMLLSLIFIRHMFNLQQQLEELRKQNEGKVISAILKTEESERLNFSKELHDGLGPLLSAVKMSVSSILEKKDISRKVLVNAENLVDESIITLREISNRLSPHILTDFGLEKAIHDFIDRLVSDVLPDIHFKSNIEGRRYSFNVEVLIYRVVCELISNTIKHAGAANIFIDLVSTGSSLNLKYIDDGAGFETSGLNGKFTGMGYSSIKSRVKSLDGKMTIYSAPGDGIEICIELKTE